MYGSHMLDDKLKRFWREYLSVTVQGIVLFVYLFIVEKQMIPLPSTQYFYADIKN